MKKFWAILSVLIAISAVVIYATPNLRQKAILLFSYSTCDNPLPYKIGEIDQRFDLTNTEVENYIQEATGIWNKQEGKKLFEENPNAGLTVNFVYDVRQALDTQITQLNTQLGQSSQSLEQQISDFQAEKTSFEQKLAAFNQTVDQYNRQGGAPPDVYEDLIKQQKDLNTEAAILNAKAKQLNLSTENYNTNVDVFNQDVSQFNAALAKKPEEGLFSTVTNTITIYFASDHQELIHTLAHEFGHYLGMRHVNDQNAIMYTYTNKNTVPTTDDDNELSYACREQSLPVHLIQSFDQWLYDLMKQNKLVN